MGIRWWWPGLRFLRMSMIKMTEDNDHNGSIEDGCWFWKRPKCLWLWAVLSHLGGRSCIVSYLIWWERIHYKLKSWSHEPPISGTMGTTKALPGSPAPPWPSLTRSLLETEAMVVQIHPHQSTEDRLTGSSSDNQSPAGGDMPKWNPVITIKVWKNINNWSWCLEARQEVCHWPDHKQDRLSFASSFFCLGVCVCVLQFWNGRVML